LLLEKLKAEANGTEPSFLDKAVKVRVWGRCNQLSASPCQEQLAAVLVPELTDLLRGWRQRAQTTGASPEHPPAPGRGAVGTKPPLAGGP